MPNRTPLESAQLTLGGIGLEYTVFSRRFFTGTISDLPYPARLAWGVILFEAERLKGRVKLPARDLAKMASITTAEAVDALRRFQEPDEFSSSKEYEGRRLLPIEGEEDWYQLVTWEKHVRERQAFFNRLRQQRHYERKKAETNLTQPNDDSRDLTNEPEPEPELPSAKGKRKRAGVDRLTEPTAEHRKYAAKHAPGSDVDDLFREWTNHNEARGWKTREGPIKDFAASFRTWIDNAPKFARGGSPGKRQRVPAAHEPFEPERA